MIDVLLVTALKEEHDAARDVATAGCAGDPGIARWEPRDRDTPTPYLYGTYILRGGGGFSVALARPTRMGGVSTAPVVSALVERLRPRCLAMSGICAGNPAGVALGDVIVAESTYASDEGRRTIEGFDGDHRQFMMRDTWIRAAQELVPTDLPSFVHASDDDARAWILERLAAGEDPKAHPAIGQYFTQTTWVSRVERWLREQFLVRAGAGLAITDKGRSVLARMRFDDVHGPARLPFRIVVGPMASGSAVVKDGVTWDHLTRLGMRTVLGLEMEAVTIASTAHRLGVENWVVVKGVTDHADDRKDDRYRRFAARASAEVLFTFLAAQLSRRSDRQDTSKAGPTIVPRQLPLAPATFTGRTRELAALTAALADVEPDGGRARVAAVVGPGGVGKTWAALHWAHRHARDFPDGQIYLDLRGVGRPKEEMSQAVAVRCLLDALNVDPRTVPDVLDAQIGLYRSLIDGRRILTVLDNARDATDVAALLPGSATCAVIVTSRNRMDALAVSAGASQVELGPLTEPEARDLFVQRLGPARVENEPRAVAALLEYCAGLPLAIGVVVNRARSRSSIPLAELAAELSDVKTRVEAFGSGDPATSLDRVLSWSYSALTPEDAASFRLLGLAPGPDVTVTALAALVGQPPSRARATLRSLEQMSLVMRRREGRWGVHTLVRLYAARQAELVDGAASRVTALARLADHYLYSANAADRMLYPDQATVDMDPAPPGCQPDTFDGPAAAAAWFTAEHTNVTAMMRLATAHGWHMRTWLFARVLHTYHWRTGRLTDQVVSWRNGLDAAQESGDRSRVALAHRLLGSALSKIGDRDEAIDHLRNALRLSVQLADTTVQGETHRTLARVYEQRADHRAALEHATTALHLFRSVTAPLREADALDLICWIQTQLGRFEQAETNGRAALALYRECGDSDGEATALDTMGYIAYRTGRHTAAAGYYRQALALFDGRNAYHEANTLFRLGTTYADVGEPDRARSAWERALRLFRAQQRPDDADRVTRRLAGLPTIPGGSPEPDVR